MPAAPKSTAARVPGAGALLALAALILLLGPRDAAADFGECSSPAYLAGFDERFETGAYDCVERLRVTVSTRSGPRDIRLVHDLSAGWAADGATMAQFERGVTLSAAQLARMGSFDLQDVTILLADDFPPPEGAVRISNIAAWTSREHTGVDDECKITLYLVGPAATAEHAASTIAHELFHCVQKANLAPTVMASYTADGHGGAWWMEGSAEWFASAAVPDLASLQDRADQFDADSPTTPLFHMSYQAVPFFFWFVGERGDAAVLPFLSGMAHSASDEAQAGAMRAALSDDQWLDFAKAYLDNQIRRPTGAPVTFNPREGDTVRWVATRTERRPLQPFVLDRAWLECDCGEWTTSAEPGEVHQVRPADGEWGALPEDIDTEEDDPDRYRLAAFNTGASDRSLELEFTHEVGCEGCGDGELDECLVGTWRLSSGGPVEWMRREMPPEFQIPSHQVTGDATVTFHTRGSYDGGPVHQQTTITARSRRGISRADGDAAAQGSGRWSAEDGQLTFCPTHESFGGTAVITTPRGDTHTMALPVPAPTGPLSMDYSCSEGSFTTTLRIPGARTPIETTYTRIPGPPS